jgi:hypothetical protein
LPASARNCLRCRRAATTIFPAETLARFEAARVGATEPGALGPALAASVLALIREGVEAGLPHADAVAARLAEFPPMSLTIFSRIGR